MCACVFFLNLGCRPTAIQKKRLTNEKTDVVGMSVCVWVPCGICTPGWPLSSSSSSSPLSCRAVLLSCFVLGVLRVVRASQSRCFLFSHRVSFLFFRHRVVKIRLVPPLLSSRFHQGMNEKWLAVLLKLFVCAERGNCVFCFFVVLVEVLSSRGG